MKKIVPICAAVAAAAMMLSISTSAMAMGGPSGPHVTYPVQGNIGEVIVNPYKVAPLTAVIRDAGYDLSDVTVRIVPKTNGQEITYKVSRTELKTSFPHRIENPRRHSGFRSLSGLAEHRRSELHAHVPGQV